MRMAGTASLGVGSRIDGPRRPARVIAAFPAAVYLELPAPGPEPRVLALVTPTAVRLPNAVVVTPDPSRDSRDPGARRAAVADRGPLPAAVAGSGPHSSAPHSSGPHGSGPYGSAAPGSTEHDCAASVGEGAVQAGRMLVPVRRWWDPSPVLCPLSRVRIAHASLLLQQICPPPA